MALHGIPVPESYYVSNSRNFKKAVANLGCYPVVAKTINSRQGKSVILVASPLILEFIIDNLPIKRQGRLVQEYIVPRERKNIQAPVLGGRVIAEHLASLGYRGLLGIDFLIDEWQQRVYPIEINPRFTGAPLCGNGRCRCTFTTRPSCR